MNKTFLTTKIVPITAIILCILLYLFGYFHIIIAALLLIIASAIEYKKDIFKSLGFQRKRLKLKDLFIIAPLFSISLFLVYIYVLVPGVAYLTEQPINFSVFKPYKGNLSACFSLLILIWISAAFGEEIIFRGYLMRQFTKFFGANRVSMVVNILLFGIVFGFIHSYQGITGQIISGLIGMLYAVIFHIRKNDLWFNIAAHGFFDTVAVLFIFNGWG